MANDIDMYNDIEKMGKDGESQELFDLMDCYVARYQEGDLVTAGQLKELFIKDYGYWGNWY